MNQSSCVNFFMLIQKSAHLEQPQCCIHVIHSTTQITLKMTFHSKNLSPVSSSPTSLVAKALINSSRLHNPRRTHPLFLMKILTASKISRALRIT